MQTLKQLVDRPMNAVRSGAIGGYSIVGILVIALAVIGLLYLFNRA